jgi:hypothetical protein
MSWLTQYYGKWDFLRYTSGVHRFWRSPHYISSTYFYIWSKKPALVQLINYQLFDLLLSLELNSYTRNQKLLHSRTINLCCRWPYYAQSRLLEIPCPTLFSYGNFHLFIYLFIYLYFVLGSKGLLVSGYCPSPYVCYLMGTSCCPCISENSLTDPYFLCRLLTGYPT